MLSIFWPNLVMRCLSALEHDRFSDKIMLETKRPFANVAEEGR